ncbi:AzlD domain-containing protein [Inhella crocodyli]|uniref:AzlD domain-containing protein n=1 Tax=Inhella crocodyli TaxID=2499851 RepID=A0A3S2UU47_9BURK|nr:AzlD domain-containing protein [Inhella crocodyli]RVT84690.1 AzlD domain-containing protein [Inhella crocodyli]
MTEAQIWIVIAGLTGISVLARNFFMLSERPWPMPHWAREALKVAPLAALVAVVAPEVFMTQGQLIGTWQDPRWPAALVGTLAYFWRRSILATIVCGMAAMLVLKLGFGW